MYCKNCGKEINDNAAICPFCGVVVNKNALAQNSENQTNVLAIVGFIFSFLIAIVGLICSIIGYKKAPELNGNGKGLALAGIIISAIGIGIAVLLIVFLIIGIAAL